MNLGTKLVVLIFCAALTACYVGDPIPVECVCQCDQAKAGSTSGIVPRIPTLPRKGAKGRDAARAKKIAAKKAAAAKRGNPLGGNPLAKRGNPLAKRAADAAKRAEGRIARKPGSGDVIKTDARSLKAMT
ncbi:MAG: hypothetical protein QF464_04175, partial [Myxococcota bacterium]|nr:hypothetical protein [Myxococcota bacterium]